MKRCFLLRIFMLIFCGLACAEEHIKVTVTRVDNDSWLVDYQLPEAVNKVYFYRVGSLPRDNWRLENSKLKLYSENDKRHYIESHDGTLFQSIRLFFDSDFRTTPKDYELNFSFSDGAVLLYTGHLLLALSDDSHMDHKFHFKPFKQNHIIVQGKAGINEQYWLDDELKGTYIYYGQNLPVKSKHMLAVIDPGLPPWIKDRLVQDLPKLFAFYASETGLNLDFMPMVFFSYYADPSPGTQYSGGTLPGLIQLSVKGDDWHQASLNNLTGLLHFLAHEAAHLWNSQLVETTGDKNDSWIHEGGADAFATRALAKLGIITADEVLIEHEKYLNACIETLNKYPVSAFEKHQNFSVYYHCGATIALLTERVMKQKDPQTDLFDFWSNLLQRIKGKGLKLTVEQYLKSLALLTENTTAIERIISLIDEPQPQPIEFFTQMFKSTGLSIVPVSEHPKQDQKAMSSVMKHLMLIDCHGYSYQRHGRYFTVGDKLNCNQLKPQMKIHQVLALDVNLNGHAIHAKVREQCLLGSVVTLQTLEQGEIKITCNQPLEPNDPWLSLVQEDITN